MTSTETYFLGVDGGGSGCRAAIARSDGKAIGTGSGGPANATTDADGAVTNILSAVREATSDAGISDEVWRSAKTHVGLAGIMSDVQAAEFASKLPFSATISDDRPTSLLGALGERHGVLAAVGTGSLLGVSKDNEMRFIGGWGFQVGDQASGAWLGRALLEQVLLCHDGLVATSPLIDDVFRTFDNDPNNIVAFARDADPFAFAKLAPDIVSAAENGDLTGSELMSRGARYLEQAFAVLDPDSSMEICLTGGVGKRYKNWLSEINVERIIPPVGTALDGALLLARNVT